MILTTIGVTPPARRALLTIDVGLDRATVAQLDVRHAFADRDDFNAKLVPRNARVTEERHLAEITRDVGAANPDTVHAHHNVSGPRPGRRVDFNAPPCLRLFQL